VKQIFSSLQCLTGSGLGHRVEVVLSELRVGSQVEEEVELRLSQVVDDVLLLRLHEVEDEVLLNDGSTTLLVLSHAENDGTDRVKVSVEVVDVVLLAGDGRLLLQPHPLLLSLQLFKSSLKSKSFLGISLSSFYLREKKIFMFFLFFTHKIYLQYRKCKRREIRDFNFFTCNLFFKYHYYIF
jgi:hypothetical protein